MGIIRDLLHAASSDTPSPLATPAPAPTPPLDVTELKHAKFAQLLEKTMISSSEVMHTEPLKEQVSGYMTSCLKAKSHSVSNTKRTIQQIFDTAIETRTSDKDKDVLRWVQFCVETCLSQQQASDGSPSLPPPNIISNADDEDKSPLKKEKKPSKKKVTVSSSKKDNDDDCDDDDKAEAQSVGYHVIGASDDDYRPSDDDDDQQVPTLKTRTKKKKDNKDDEDEDEDEDQQVPDTDEKKKKKPTRKREPDQPPFIQSNAGSKAVASYFMSTHPMSVVVESDYFAKSYFFPSKESFNAFISVLNSAQKTIDVCIFALTDDDVADALIAAKQRNVDIRIITDNQQAAGIGADADRLQKDYGIPYKTDHTVGYMHNKFAVVDSKTLINGSFNWSKGARFKNRENIIITNLPYCIKEFQVQFEALWEEF